MPPLPIPQNAGRGGTVGGAESPVWVVEHSMTAGVWTDEARTSKSCRHGLGRTVAQCHGDLGLQLKPWNLKGWNTEKARLTVPNSQESSSGQTRPGEHARWAPLLFRMRLEGEAQRRTQEPSISLWHEISFLFPMRKQRPRRQ